MSMDNEKVHYCVYCAYAKKRLFKWMCNKSGLGIVEKKNYVTGKIETIKHSCYDVRCGLYFCKHYERRGFAPPIQHRNPLPPLSVRGHDFVPPKETPMHKAPMHKAPLRESEIDGCDSCKWHQPGGFNGPVMYHVCKHEKSWWGWYNLKCIDMRSNEDFCGKEKRLYEPKETSR